MTMRNPDHYRDPLRQIVRREVHDGKPFVLLICDHVSPGKPASRYSRFYPCVTCAEIREVHRKDWQARHAPAKGKRKRS